MAWAAKLAAVATMAAVAAAVLALPAAAQLDSCRGYPRAPVVAAIKSRIEVLRRIEREAADRIAGLDTRPYEWLLEQARTAQADIADPALLEAEAALQRCRNFIRPVRRHCADGAAALVRVIEILAADGASKDAKGSYAQAMPHCERALNLAPLNSALRAAD